MINNLQPQIPSESTKGQQYRWPFFMLSIAWTGTTATIRSKTDVLPLIGQQLSFLEPMIWRHRIRYTSHRVNNMNPFEVKRMESCQIKETRLPSAEFIAVIAIICFILLNFLK